MDSAKHNIRKVVETYTKVCADEYALFRDEAMPLLKSSLEDQKFGTSKGTDMRAIIEMPVTLHEMLVNNLTEEQLVWFKSGGPDKKEGARWFATTFPVFALAQI